jgi:hypothetical protein
MGQAHAAVNPPRELRKTVAAIRLGACFGTPLFRFREHSVTRYGKGGKMEELHLDPSCDFVREKSAETDGMDWRVAKKHFDECGHCRQYHGMQVRKEGKLSLLIGTEMAELEAQEDRKAAEQRERKKKLERHLDLVLLHFEPEKITLVSEYESSPGTIQVAASVQTEAGILDIGTWEQDQWRVHFRGQASGSVQKTVTEVLHFVAKAIAKRRFENRKEKQ